MYFKEIKNPGDEDVVEGYNLHKNIILKAWARYRPNYSKNKDMFSKKKKKDPN